MAATSTLPLRQKVSATKIEVVSPDVMKMYNKGILKGFDLINWRATAYHFDQKSNSKLCLHIFFDLMDVACANSRIIYNMMDPNDLSLRNFKIIDSTYLIETYTSQNSAQPDARTGSKKVSVSV